MEVIPDEMRTTKKHPHREAEDTKIIVSFVGCPTGGYQIGKGSSPHGTWAVLDRRHEYLRREAKGSSPKASYDVPVYFKVALRFLFFLI